jgi:hypothetical protein
MKRIKNIVSIISLTAMILVPSVLLAQGTKKEVHIKIVENGKVTKDTSYTVTGDLPETDRLPGLPPHCQGMPPDHMKMMCELMMQDSIMRELHKMEGDMMHQKHMMEMQEMMMGDSMKMDMKKMQECAEMQHKHMSEMHTFIIEDSIDTEMGKKGEGEFSKQYKVIVTSPGEGENEKVEEIWLGKPDDGRPCRTIIIHEGDCPEGMMEKNVEVIVKDGPGSMDTPPPPPPAPGDNQTTVTRKVIKTDGGKKVTVIETRDDGKKEEPKKK